MTLAYNIDCMEYMKGLKDNEFELAIVDPPYGISINNNMGRRKKDFNSGYKKITWDNEIPSQKYFDELFRVSKNQIIWGGNYFIDSIRNNSSCWIVWDKKFSEDVSFSQCELAYTSFPSVVKKFEMAYKPTGKIHPTQKPVALYKWLLKNYANKGDTILDTHLGSGSSRIACHDMGFEFVGLEIDKDYFESQEKRFKTHSSQHELFEFYGGEVK